MSRTITTIRQACKMSHALRGPDAKSLDDVLIQVEDQLAEARDKIERLQNTLRWYAKPPIDEYTLRARAILKELGDE